MKALDFLKLAVSVLVSQLAGIAGAAFTTRSLSTWYVDLRRPAFNPPNWLFAPAWIILYTFMGVAAFLVWQRGLEHRETRIALSLFLVQLVLNTFWSIIFFGFQSPLGGLIEIGFLWVAILITLIYFYRISAVAGLLLVPYVLWVTFAAVLNFSIWRLNP